MKKLGKITLWAISIIVIFFVLVQCFIFFNQEKIATTINNEIQKSINGEIHIGAISLNLIYDFPKTTLSIKDVYLRGPKFNHYKRDFLKIEQLFVRVHLWKLIKGEIDLSEISLRNAEVFIFKTKDGYSNLAVFKQKKQTDSTTINKQKDGMLANIENISIENTKINYHDSLLGKSFGLTLVKTKSSVKTLDNQFIINLKGQIDFLGLMFKKEKGTFLKNTNTVVDLNLAFTPSKKSLKISESTIGLKSGVVNLNALFKFEKPLWYQLDISSKSIEASEGIGVLTESIQKKLSKFNVSGMVATKVLVHGFSIPGIQPSVKVNFKTNKASAFLMNKYHFNELATIGYFTNQIDGSMPVSIINTAIVLDTLNGIAEGFNIKLKSKINNLSDPMLMLNVNVTGRATSLNNHLDSSKTHINRGFILTNFFYEGKLKEYENSQINSLTGKLTGDFKLINASVSLPEKNLVVSPINCNIQFNRDQLIIQKLLLYFGKDYVSITGKIDHFIPFFTQVSEKSFVQLNLKANRINLGNFMKQKKLNAANKLKKNELKKIYETALKIHEKITYDISVQTDELVKDRFKATQVKTNLRMKNDNLTIGPFEAKFAGGTIALTGEIKKFSQDWSPFKIQTKIRRVNMSEFMYSFNNFGSKSLTSKNIFGKMNAQIDLSSLLDNNANFMNKHLKGHVTMVVQNGQLINYKPIMEMGNFIMTNRDFKNISFSKIEADLKTYGTETDIKRMEISTNVARLFIEGRYSFKDSTYILLQVPLSNFKKHDKNVKPENIGTDSKLGPSIFLSIKTNEQGKMKIAYQPFSKKSKSK